MQFLGLVWVTSWVSCFLASSQGLSRVPDYLTPTFPARILSVVNSPIEVPTPIFRTPLYSGIGSSNSFMATLPNLAFQTGAGSFPSGQFTQTSVHSPVAFKGSEDSLCRSQTKLQNPSLPVTPPPSQSVSWDKSSLRETSKSTLPQQIFQAIQSLFPWRQRSESVKTLASSITIVSTQSGERITDKLHNQGRKVKRGLWRYSQLLASRAFASHSQPEPEQFQVWVKDRLIAQLPRLKYAELMASRLKQVLSDPSDPYLDNSPIRPVLREGKPALKVGERLLFEIDDTLAADLDHNSELLIIEWANNLRTVLGKAALPVADAQKQMHELVETSSVFTGQASWYGTHFHGRLTAAGEVYNQHELTAAHPSLPFNTYLKVKNLNNGASVIVRINDRGPYIPNRNLDLSNAAARCIGSEKVGVVPFEAVIMQPPTALRADQYLVRN
jgi:rare lipoprotein A